MWSNTEAKLILKCHQNLPSNFIELIQRVGMIRTFHASLKLGFLTSQFETNRRIKVARHKSLTTFFSEVVDIVTF